MADNFASFLSNLRQVEKKGKYHLSEIDSYAERLEDDSHSLLIDTHPSTGRDYGDYTSLDGSFVGEGREGYFPSSTIGERQYNDTSGMNLLEGSTMSTLSALTTHTAMPPSPTHSKMKGRGPVKKGGNRGMAKTTITGNKRNKRNANKSNKILLKSMHSTGSSGNGSTGSNNNTNSSSIFSPSGVLDASTTKGINSTANGRMNGNDNTIAIPSGTDFDAWLEKTTISNTNTSTSNSTTSGSTNVLQNLKSVTRLTKPSLRRIHDDLVNNTAQLSLIDQERHTAALMSDLVGGSTLLKEGDGLPRHLREFKKGYTKVRNLSCPSPVSLIMPLLL